MSFKHNDTRNAVQQVVSLHSLLATINDELARAREEYSPARYQIIEAEKLQQFRQARSDLEDSVQTLKRTLLAAAEEQEAAMPCEQTIDMLANYLTSYAPSDSAFANPDEQKRSFQMFSILDNSEPHLFEMLDNSI